MSNIEPNVYEVIEYVRKQKEEGKSLETYAASMASLFQYTPEAMFRDPTVLNPIRDFLAYARVQKDNPFIDEAVRDQFTEKMFARVDSAISKAASNPRIYHRTLGAGTYGFVVQPAFPNRTATGEEVTFPGNVTKVFYNEQEYWDALKKLQLVPGMLGHNEGHRVNTYRRLYTARNITSNVSQKIRDKYAGRPHERLRMIRMPALGVDIRGAIKHKKHILALQQIPITVIVAQVKKLVQQTQAIAANGYIHTDIRDQNVMVDPATGIFTIIDFDWLEPAPVIFKKYPFGFYNNPPETLMISNILSIDRSGKCTYPSRSRLSYLPTEEELEKERRLYKRWEDYKHYIWEYNQHVMAIRGIHDDNWGHVILDAVCNKTLPPSSYKEEEVFRTRVAPTFDNFGLGFALLELFLHLYPGCILPHDDPRPSIESFLVELKPLITDRGSSYSDSELAGIGSVLRKLAVLFNRMSSFVLAERPLPAEVVAIVTECESQLAGGQAGGRRRRTIRRSMKPRRSR